MKVLKQILVCSLLAALAVACTKPAPASLNLLSTVLTFDSAGGTEEVSILTNQSWSVRAGADWLTVTPPSGSASDAYQKLTVTAQENAAETERTAELTLTAGEITKLIQVKQAGAPRFIWSFRYTKRKLWVFYFNQKSFF